jgi:hypothetical protein
MPARSSTMPRLVLPAEATTAKTSSAPCRSSAAASPSPVRRWSGVGTTSTSTSMTAAEDRTDECTLSATATRQRSGRPPRRSAAAWRAATSAERLPFVPPWTNTPPASGGRPARSASQRRAWFSAKTAPAPSYQLPP